MQENTLKCKIKLSITLIFLLIILSCSNSKNIMYNNLDSQESTLVWPPYPQTPKIKFLTCIYAPSDFGISKSWFENAIDMFFGKEQFYGTMLRPYGIYAFNKNLYITDPGAHIVHIYDSKGKYILIKDAGSEEIQSPIGIAVDEEDNIYVTDSALKKVFVFDANGKFRYEIGSSNLFIRPSGIALTKDTIYVIDTHSHRVLVFNKKGELLFSFGNQGNQKGEFNYPTNIFIDKQEILYITDSLNFRIQIFDKNGKFLSMFGKAGDGSGDLSRPKGVAVDSEGHIYVVDSNFDNVQIFDKEGRLLLVFGKTGTGNGELILPAGIFIDNDDFIYLADSYNHRIQVFKYLKNKVE